MMDALRLVYNRFITLFSDTTESTMLKETDIALQTITYTLPVWAWPHLSPIRNDITLNTITNVIFDH